MSKSPTKSLDGRVALVTGGSRGIGAQIAKRLAAEGAITAISFRRDLQAAEAVVSEIVANGGRAKAYCAPAEDSPASLKMLDGISSSFGPIDLLVSNAGTASTGRSVLDTQASEFDELMRVHALGPLTLIQAVLPGMRAASRADIIIISSATVVEAPANCAPYTMAKAALEVAARTLALEERAHGVRVNIVAPGLVDTDMGSRLVRAVRSGEALDVVHAAQPFGRVCTPADVAAVVAFLVSDGAGYVTRQRIAVDGGGHEPSII
jgi:NAD(P)-dependent dehydrogenase (short-subunit alcohol dehydrogenase family)